MAKINKQFFQAKGSDQIYSSKTGKPLKSEEQFLQAGGTPYWREGFEGESNVQIVSSPEAAEETAQQLQQGTREFEDAPEQVFDTSKTKDLSAFLESLQSQQQRRLTELREEREKARTEKKDLMTKMREATIDKSKLIQEQRDKFEMEENIQRQQALIDEASVLRTELADIEAQKRQELIEEEGKPLSTDYIQGQKALIERQYNSRIQAKAARLNAKTATIQALQGNLSQARTLANEMVSAEVWDWKQKRDNIAMEIQQNEGLLNDLGQEYKNTWNQALQTAQTRYENKRKQAQQKKELLLDASSRGVNLGDVTDMSLKDVQNAYAEQVSGQVKAQMARSRGTTVSDAGNPASNVSQLAKQYILTGNEKYVPAKNKSEWSSFWGIVNKQLGSESPPKWFSDMVIKEYGEQKQITPMPDTIQREWEKVKQPEPEPEQPETDYTDTQKLKLEQQLGSNWQDKPRQEQLNALFGDEEDTSLEDQLFGEPTNQQTTQDDSQNVIERFTSWVGGFFK